MDTIENETDYRTALERVAALMHAEAGTPEGEELTALADLVHAYETRTIREFHKAESARMTTNYFQMLGLLAGYRARLLGAQDTVLLHVVERMIPTMEALIASASTTTGGSRSDLKLNRWLGFIQGVLYTKGLQTIEEMRAQNLGLDVEVEG